MWLIDIDYERFAQCVAYFDAPTKALLPCSISVAERINGVFVATFYDGGIIVSPEHKEVKEIRSEGDIFKVMRLRSCPLWRRAH